jgi:hypothetical protein
MGLADGAWSRYRAAGRPLCSRHSRKPRARYQGGAKAFLQRPVDDAKLLAVIRASLGRTREAERGHQLIYRENKNPLRKRIRQAMKSWRQLYSQTGCGESYSGPRKRQVSDISAHMNSGTLPNDVDKRPLLKCAFYSDARRDRTRLGPDREVKLCG